MTSPWKSTIPSTRSSTSDGSSRKFLGMSLFAESLPALNLGQLPSAALYVTLGPTSVLTESASSFSSLTGTLDLALKLSRSVPPTES